jgi:S1-C subfamily serine protease
MGSMNYIDVFIIIFVIAAMVRGHGIGFVRQIFSTVGFFGGLWLGSLLQPMTVQLASSALGKSIITLVTTIGMATLFLIVGELIGIKLKQKIISWRANLPDSVLGAALAGLTFLLAVWLSAAIITALPNKTARQAIDGSAIITTLNRILPSGPKVVANLERLIDPNGFPRVFTGREPAPAAPNATPPSLGEMRAVAERARPSVVKLEGRGCGGIIDGSGFVIDENLVITNAHVIAGLDAPRIVDDNGNHATEVIWFNPSLDVAILRSRNLAGQPLKIIKNAVPPNTPAVVLGYPGGGDFVARPASVTARFSAHGLDIYNRSSTIRDVYELSADIVPGNSGGPVIGQDGQVLGMIFAESATYENIGYALTSPQILKEINSAKRLNRSVDTGSCTQR